MKKFRSILCMLLALAMVLVFCACGQNDDTDDTDNSDTPGNSDTPDSSENPDGTDTPASGLANPSDGRQDLIILNMDEYAARPTEIQEGTVLNFVAPNDVPSQLPWNATSEDWLMGNVYESLLHKYLGTIDDIRGCLAESWEHSEDYLTWTFKIREGVTFTDGTVCDAAAIAESWEYTKEASPAVITNYNIDSWEATDATTLVVHLSAPCAYFEVALSGNSLYVVSPTALATYGINDNRAAIGTGPYYIENYSSGVSINLKANENYYYEEKMPCIETINFQIIKDSNTVLMALLNGDVDGANFNVVESYYNLIDNGYEGNIIATLGNADPLWFNAKTVPILQNIEARMAMDRFIDFTAINDLVFDGMGVVMDSIWNTGSSGYVQSDKFYYDPDEGNELLASIGAEATDIVFDSTILESGKNEFVAIQNELGKSGVQMGVEVIEAEANFTYLMNGEWSITTGCVGYRNATPYLPWTYILKPDALIKQCWQDVYDPDLYQKMLDEYDAMVTSATWDEMLEHCKQITIYEQDDFGAVGAIQAPSFVILSKDFKNPIYYTESHDLQLYYLYQ